MSKLILLLSLSLTAVVAHATDSSSEADPTLEGQVSQDQECQKKGGACFRHVQQDHMYTDAPNASQAANLSGVEPGKTDGQKD